MARNILDCAVCFRRAVLGFPHGGAVANATAFTPWGRRFATAAATTNTTSTTSTTTVDAPRTLEAETAEPSLVEKRSRERLETIVKKHLRHMSDDPWLVAQYVEKALARDAFDEALLLVQKASRGKQMVVAWNHLIDYQLSKQQVKRALKIYNDMKKRAQLPNVRTYTVIFRGLAKSQHPKLAVAEAVKHYNVLLNDKRLEPNSIHLNAVLNVCARAGDLDSLFLIVNSVNESTRSPTAFTYTTILNALRHSAIGEMKDLPEEQKQANIEKLLGRAKGLWEEVIQKWTAGRLVIDEELVCAMGRLLLMSPTKEEKRQVFDLLEQTMSIPNLMAHPELGSQLDDSMKDIAVSEASKPVPSTRKTVYAVPSRNTLALVLTTLATTRQTTSGIKYWNLMIRHYGVIPDNDIWLRMFGLLKVAKASGHASSILEIMPDEYIDAKPFCIAMETCVRDNLNHNVVKNATKTLDTMLERLKIPDLHTLRLYLRVALVSHSHFRTMAKEGQVEEAKRLYGVQITEALSHLWEPYKQTHYHYFKAAKPRGEAGEKAIYNGKREVIALARQMVSAFDKIVNEKMLPDRELGEIKPIAAKINREIQKFFHERELHEPNLPSTRRPKADAEEVESPPREAVGTEEGESSPPANDEMKALDIEEDEFTIKHGPEWVWDTYKPVTRDRVPYPWESSPRETTRGSSRSTERRPRRDKKRF